MPEPAQPPESQPAATPRLAATPAQGGPWRILVLDNEPLIVAALSRDLMDRGHEVAPAESVAEAEEIILNGPWPDAAVVDVNLTSEESGPEFVARMEQRFQRQLPTLVLTGGTDADTLGTLTRSGRRWLTKPAEPEHVATALGEVVTTSRQGPAIDKADRLEDALRS
jgi:DNA-binding response OmpR family regulator